MENPKFIQTPREVRKRRVDFSSFLSAGETLDAVSVTIVPPTASIQQSGYVAPGLDQRVVKIDTSSWVFNSVNVTFPLVTTQGVGVAVLADQYVTVVLLGNTVLNPGVDFTVTGSQITFAVAPAPGQKWCIVQNPILPATERRDPLADPPYSAFSALGFLVAPDNKKVLIASMGGAAPNTYRARLLVHTTEGQTKEVDLDYSIREP